MSPLHKPRNLSVLLVGALALAGCETMNRAVNEAVGNNFAARLAGVNEVPRGDPDGIGTAQISINEVTNQICVRLEVQNIGPVTAAHIHQGRAGVNGPAVIPLDPPDDDDSNDCDIVADALVNSIVRDPASFYVNVHTADYPNGAIRGQVFNVRS